MVQPGSQRLQPSTSPPDSFGAEPNASDWLTGDHHVDRNRSTPTPTSMPMPMMCAQVAHCCDGIIRTTSGSKPPPTRLVHTGTSQGFEGVEGVGATVESPETSSIMSFLLFLVFFCFLFLSFIVSYCHWLFISILAVIASGQCSDVHRGVLLLDRLFDLCISLVFRLASCVGHHS